MDLSRISYYLIDIGSITLAISFVLFVIHTTLLAAGGRVTAAGAGGRVATATAGGPNLVIGRRDATAAGGMGQAFAWASLVLLGLGMLIRAYLVGRGPFGNLYEFTVAFAFGIVLAYLFLGRRYPIRSIAFLPTGVSFFPVSYTHLTLPTKRIV